MDHRAAKPLRVTNLFQKPVAVNHPSADNHTQCQLIWINTPLKYNRLNDCKYCLPSQHTLCLSINEYLSLLEFCSRQRLYNKESASKWEDMEGGIWFQIDLNSDSKLKSCLAAFKVSCCLFSRVKENIQENNRKSVYSSTRTLLGLSPFQHYIIMYMKVELTSAKP